MDTNKENVDPRIDSGHASDPRTRPFEDIDEDKQPTQASLVEEIGHSHPRLESLERLESATRCSGPLNDRIDQVPETERPSAKHDPALRNSQMSPSNLFLSQRRHSAPASPTKRTIRTLTEIAAASPRSDISEEIDTDFRIMSTQDLAYQEAIQSSVSSPIPPSRKRRHGTNDRAPQQSNIQKPRSAAPETDKVESRADSKLPDTTRHVTSRRVEKENSKRSKTYLARSKLGAPETIPESTLATTSEKVPTNASTIQKDAILQPHRVFAKFKGGKNAYYPATCLSVKHSEKPLFKVRFDDGMIDFLSSQFVRQLDLRQGDVVKVDLDHMRTTNNVVLGLTNRIFDRFRGQTESKNMSGTLTIQRLIVGGFKPFC